MGYIRWFLSFLKKYRVRMIVGLILVFITALLVLINPQISGMIVDEVIEGQHYEKLGILLLIYDWSDACSIAAALHIFNVF